MSKERLRRIIGEIDLLLYEKDHEALYRIAQETVIALVELKQPLAFRLPREVSARRVD